MIDRSLTLDAVGEVLRSAGLLREQRGPGDVAVLGVCQDSRSVRPGDLFLAWKGTSEDAHDHVAAAARAGAVAAVVERPVDAPVPQLVVSDGRSAGAIAAQTVFGNPSHEVFLVGVTGTNGKTTTAVLIRHLLAARGKAAAVGTLGLVDADGVRPGTEGLTTPGPVQLASWLRQLADEGVASVALEASSHALEQRRLEGVRFAAGVFTNLTQDHLDYHPDLEAYFAAKARLVSLVKADGWLLVNRDDPAWDALDVAGRHVRTFAVDSAADLRAEDVALDAGGSRFTLVVGAERVRVELPLLGAYNVENALAAAAVASVVGMGAAEIARGLASVPQVPGRLEAVLRKPYAVLIDFAHTPDALEGALGALRPLTRGRLIVVFGAGGDRDRTKRGPMAQAVARFADLMVLTSDNPRTEDPESILDDLAAGLPGATFARIADRRQAIRHALGLARAGDTVVLAGKGHETYQTVGREKRPFDERVVVRECLSELGAA
ncbi:MAG: UDP-N-acetylmuramoyl-L-alanyl-D-glutamate--2,6-diaminopimelate ligase [Longimicrobiales bacterium]|nr:UDP-N-acetylmuramoyl-L-alanyl-D-glutamate--2,6-diaminopimelate ligase [Longimicrobiales bacterium]